ncbi:phnA protein [Neptunomonas phycophila]|uniref:phnA protein n=1 Tax=Neptunomonas phycophila TaxID=1572645 RepID=UPI0009490FF2|nr:phnA protein [Neptunomonas phycophila]
MSRKEKHHERHANLTLFGKDLVRRCAAHCELCQQSGVPLNIFEVPPVPSEPDYEHCLMICETCQTQVERPKRLDANHWRCLGTTMWSEVTAAKVTAMVILNHLAKKEAWAQELLEQAYLSEQEEAWIAQWTLV